MDISDAVTDAMLTAEQLQVAESISDRNTAPETVGTVEPEEIADPARVEELLGGSRDRKFGNG